MEFTLKMWTKVHKFKMKTKLSITCVKTHSQICQVSEKCPSSQLFSDSNGRICSYKKRVKQKKMRDEVVAQKRKHAGPQLGFWPGRQPVQGGQGPRSWRAPKGARDGVPNLADHREKSLRILLDTWGMSLCRYIQMNQQRQWQTLGKTSFRINKMTFIIKILSAEPKIVK